MANSIAARGWNVFPTNQLVADFDSDGSIEQIDVNEVRESLIVIYKKKGFSDVEIEVENVSFDVLEEDEKTPYPDNLIVEFLINCSCAEKSHYQLKKSLGIGLRLK